MGAITSKDPRKKKIVEALKMVSKSRKVTRVIQTPSGYFHGHCYSPAPNGKWNWLGVYSVKLDDNLDLLDFSVT